MVPAICTFLGAIFSCTNYFRVIFTGGVGKNGSTIAVSLNSSRLFALLQPPLINEATLRIVNTEHFWIVMFVDQGVRCVPQPPLTPTPCVFSSVLREPASSLRAFTLVRLSFWR